MRRVLLPLLLAAALAPAAMAQSGGGTQRLDAEILRLREQLVALGKAERSGQGRTQVQRARLAVLNAREAVIRARIERNESELARLLGALQMHRRHPPPPLLVNPRSARDAVRAAILIRAITPELEARGRAFAVQAEAIARVRRGAAVASEALFQAESDVADRRGEIERLTAEKRALEGRAFPGASAAEAQARAVGARAGSVEELVSGLGRAPPATPVAAGPPDRFVAPVEGAVARRFGQPQPGRGRSEGWAWRATPGSPVLSPAAGRVDYAGPLKGWGLVVILRIGGGYRLVLAGLETADVGVGREVAAGEPVGRMAEPRRFLRGGGPPSPPELYLEVRNQAEPVDPARWLSASKGG